MIHHLVLAFQARERVAMVSAQTPTPRPTPTDSRPAPVRPRPITPWNAPRAQGQRHGAPVRITTDPADARRTVIAGRLGEVCAALDRLVLEQEAA